MGIITSKLQRPLWKKIYNTRSKKPPTKIPRLHKVHNTRSSKPPTTSPVGPSTKAPDNSPLPPPDPPYPLHHFVTLPTEIRLQIWSEFWKIMMPRAQILSLIYYAEVEDDFMGKHSDPCRAKKVAWKFSRGVDPTAYNVCHESRVEGRKLGYEILSMGSHISQRRLFNPQTDTLFLTTNYCSRVSMFWGRQKPLPPALKLPVDAKQVHSIIVPGILWKDSWWAWDYGENVEYSRRYEYEEKWKVALREQLKDDAIFLVQ